MSLKLTNPISAGQYRAVYNATAVADTDWHDLTSADFLDTVDGAACAAGLKFASISMVNQGAGTAYLKYRARTLASDPTTNEIAVVNGSVWRDDVVTLESPVSTIAYKKDAAISTILFIAGFNR